MSGFGATKERQNDTPVRGCRMPLPVNAPVPPSQVAGIVPSLRLVLVPIRPVAARSGIFSTRITAIGRQGKQPVPRSLLQVDDQRLLRRIGVDQVHPLVADQEALAMCRQVVFAGAGEYALFISVPHHYMEVAGDSQVACVGFAL